MKINEILRSMSEKQVNSFIDQCRQNPSLRSASGLVRVLASRTIPSAEYKMIYEECVRGVEYSNKTWRYLTSDIFQALKRFLAENELEDHAELEEWLYLKSVHKMGLNDLFSKEARRVEKRVDKSDIPYRDKSFYKFLVAEESYEVMSTQKREAPKSLLRMNELLNEYFQSKKLQIFCSAESHRSISDFEFDDPFHQNISENITSSKPILQAYHLAYETLRGHESVNELMNMLDQLSNQLSRAEKRELYLMCINRCIRLYNKGQDMYLNKVFELYQSGLAEEIFSENGRMSRFTYRNIVTSAVGLKKYDWAMDFLERYRSALPEKQAKDLYHYHCALLSIAKKEYDNAIELLRDHRFTDPLMILDSRRLLIKVYYEKEEIDALNYLLDSFWSYLYRHKELGYHRKNYLNMVKFLRRRLSTNYVKKGQSEKLKMQIEKTENVAEKNWLLSLVR